MGYFLDDGTPVDIESVGLPELCGKCRRNSIVQDEIGCNLNRIDQMKEIQQGKVFRCDGFESR